MLKAEQKILEKQVKAGMKVAMMVESRRLLTSPALQRYDSKSNAIQGVKTAMFLGPHFFFVLHVS
jgi:hypothetical protein